MVGRGRQSTQKKARRAADPELAADEVIIDAAIDAMFTNGYHGTSVREIADRAGMSVANVYYYFPSKHDLLFRFMEGSATQLLEQLQAMLATAEPDPRVRLSEAVRLFVQRHTVRQAAAFVAATELRALDPEARAVVVDRRNAIESLFRRIVQDGADSGVFVVEDVALAVRAILDMASSVSSWYRPDGSLSGDDIADRYVGLALAVVGADRAPGAAAGTRRAPRKRRVPAEHNAR
jgi:AcrR family transcriptional regulator